MTDETQAAQEQQEQTSEAPYGYKPDGTPRKRRAPVRRAVPRRSLYPDDQHAPEKGRRPENVRTTRRSRMPIDGYRRRLQVGNMDPNYHYHWFVDNDGGDRIRDAYRNMDYDFVTHDKAGNLIVTDEDLGANISQVANRSVGGQKHYLMAKPRQMYEEDQKIKQRRNDAIDEMLRTNEPQKHLPQGKAGKVLPTAGDPHFYRKEA